jgi:hypothetical protein
VSQNRAAVHANIAGQPLRLIAQLQLGFLIAQNENDVAA